MPEQKQEPQKQGEQGKPPVQEFQPVVKEVPVDPMDRGSKEGRSLDAQSEGHTPAEKEPIQVDGDADVPGQQRYVHLPGLISDEFGTARSEARLQIATGTVEIDGEPVKLDQSLDLPYDEIVGKTIFIKGQSKSFKIDYRG